MKLPGVRGAVGLGVLRRPAPPALPGLRGRRCDTDHTTCAIALTLFATGIALSLLLIAAYSRPFTGEISVGAKFLKQVITSESAITQP